MVITRAQNYRIQQEIIQEEFARLASIDMGTEEKPSSASTFMLNDPILVTLAKEQIKTLPKFGGTQIEDVMIWLQQIEDVFDRVQLQSTGKYVAIQSYLVDAALKWFRFNKARILDWDSFKVAILQAYQPSLHQILAKLETRTQLSDESVMDYYYDKLQLCLQADSSMSSSMVIHHLTKGLKDYLIPHVVRQHPLTPDDFLRIAQAEEKVFLTLKDFSSNSTKDLGTYPAEQNYSVSAIDIHKRSSISNRPSNHHLQSSSSPRPLMDIPINSSRRSFTSFPRYSSQPGSSTLSTRQCYCCHGFGHIAAQCPSRKNV